MGSNSSNKISSFKDQEHLYRDHLKNQYGFRNPKVFSRIWNKTYTSLVVLNEGNYYLYWIDHRFNFRLQHKASTFNEVFDYQPYLRMQHQLSAVANNTEAGRKLLIDL